MVFRRGGDLDGRVPDNVRLIDLRTRKLAIALPKLVGYLKRARPDLVIAASWYAVLVALAAKRLCCPGVRLWVRQDNVHSIQAAHAGRKIRMILKIIRRLLPSAERIIAVSAGVAEDLARQAPRIAGRVRVVPNPVPHDDVAAMAAAPLDHPWFDEPGVPVILSAGRLVDQKDISTLIRAFAQVVKSRPARLVILGEGRERGALAALARELGVAEGVDLPGFVANPFAWRRGRGSSPCRRSTKGCRWCSSRRWPAARPWSAPTARTGRARCWRTADGGGSCRWARPARWPPRSWRRCATRSLPTG